MHSVTDPIAMFGVGRMRPEGNRLTLHQRLGTAVVDHRGRVEMPAYAVLAESVTSGVYWYALPQPVATVQAWLALTAGTAPRTGDRLTATAELTHHDDTYGTAAMTVTGESGAVVCNGVARAVRVGRTSETLQALDRETLLADAPAAVPRSAAAVPAPIDPGWDGGRVLAAIDRGELAAGPICELLAMSVGLTEAGPVLTVDPQPWMANPLGAIQGGVIAALVGQACSLAGQAHTGPGDDYTVADLTVHYFRSPLVDGRPATLATATERAGRRMATVSATMTDAGGTVYARAVADIVYRRAGREP